MLMDITQLRNIYHGTIFQAQTMKAQTRIALLALTLQCLKIRQRGKERRHVEADHALAFDQSFLGSLTCLHIAFAAYICTLHLYIAFAACICKQAFAHYICRFI
ncbi:hypothetical protein Tco_1462605 [Tanacetum coccineum]